MAKYEVGQRVEAVVTGRWVAGTVVEATSTHWVAVDTYCGLFWRTDFTEESLRPLVVPTEVKHGPTEVKHGPADLLTHVGTCVEVERVGGRLAVVVNVGLGQRAIAIAEGHTFGVGDAVCVNVAGLAVSKRDSIVGHLERSADARHAADCVNDRIFDLPAHLEGLGDRLRELASRHYVIVAHDNDAEVLPVPSSKRHPDENCSCLKCGGPAYQSLVQRECLTACAALTVAEPDRVHRVWLQKELTWCAEGSDSFAYHPTREGAIAAWREAVATERERCPMLTATAK